MLKLGALSPSRTRKSIGFDHSLSIGNQISMEMGPLYMDRERFEVGYAVKQLLRPWWITGKAVEIVRSNDSRQAKKDGIVISCPFKTKATWIQLSCGRTNKEAVVVRKAYKWSNPWQIAWVAVEIACTDYSRQGQEKSSGITIPCTLAAKWNWIQVRCAWIKSYSRSVMQRNKLLSWRIAWKAVETACSDNNGTERKSNKGITIACPLETK